VQVQVVREQQIAGAKQSSWHCCCAGLARGTGCLPRRPAERCSCCAAGSRAEGGGGLAFGFIYASHPEGLALDDSVDPLCAPNESSGDAPNACARSKAQAGKRGAVEANKCERASGAALGRHPKADSTGRRYRPDRTSNEAKQALCSRSVHGSGWAEPHH